MLGVHHSKKLKGYNSGTPSKKASNSSLGKYKGGKECSINSEGMWLLAVSLAGRTVCGQNSHPFLCCQRPRRHRQEKYHLLSPIGLMINETFLRTMNEQKQCPSVLHGHMTIYITPTGPWNFYKLKQLSNVLIRNQRHNPCMSTSHPLEADF